MGAEFQNIGTQHIKRSGGEIKSLTPLHSITSELIRTGIDSLVNFIYLYLFSL